MHDFYYVPRKETQSIKLKLIELILEVQNSVRDDFTFSYEFVGSANKKRNMITRDRKSNIGFDFDINIHVNDKGENYEAYQIRRIIRNAIDKIAYKYGYKDCEDSTSVLTIKSVDTLLSSIIHSCDFAIVYDCDDGRQQYIRYNKEHNNYTWEYRGGGYATLSQKEEWLKKYNYWGKMKTYYIEKKNRNENPNKHSRTLLFESVHEMCVKTGYFKD